MPQRLEDSKIHKEDFKPIPESIEKIGKLVIDSTKIIVTQCYTVLITEFHSNTI